MDINTQKPETKKTQSALLLFGVFAGKVILYTFVYYGFLGAMNAVLAGALGDTFPNVREVFPFVIIISLVYAPVVVAVIGLLVFVSRKMSSGHKKLIFLGAVLTIILGGLFLVLEI